MKTIYRVMTKDDKIFWLQRRILWIFWSDIHVWDFESSIKYHIIPPMTVLKTFESIECARKWAWEAERREEIRNKKPKVVAKVTKL